MKNCRLHRASGLLLLTALGWMVFSCGSEKEQLTRGIGIYPGNPDEDFSPVLKEDRSTYRNLAFHRPSYHSSSYDYNLTAQLITDGLITGDQPAYITLETSQGMVPKNEREWILNHVTGTAITIEGSRIWLQFGIGAGRVPEIDRVDVNGTIGYERGKKGRWEFTLSGSDNGSDWVVLSRSEGTGLPEFERLNPMQENRKYFPKDSAGNPINPFANVYTPPADEPKPSFSFRRGRGIPQRDLGHQFRLDRPVSFSIYKVELNADVASRWQIGDLDFFLGQEQVEMAPSQQFGSAWMSAGSESEWVSVDLGVPSTFDRVNLYWIHRPASGTLQVSDDGEEWTDVTGLSGPASSDPSSTGKASSEEVLELEKEVRGRYVRLNMEGDGSGGPFVLSEMEVMGTGGLVPEPEEAPGEANGNLHLAGGNWKILRAGEVDSRGEEIAVTGYEDGNWVVATVPGTALMSYRNAGALPDPNYSDNQLMISESFFNSDFWYRDEFMVPADFSGKQISLDFDGINWKAEVFVNGEQTGKIEGAFTTARFDVTGLIMPGKANAIAVLIRKNDHPGAVKEQTKLSPDRNGGILGADNPTYHASIGWDWIPTIRGRNIGIWNDVNLRSGEAVTIEDPYVETNLDMEAGLAANLRFLATLVNHSDATVKGILKGSYGEISFEHDVSLDPSGTTNVDLDRSWYEQLHFENPQLWWPNGYGEPHLYDVNLSFILEDGTVSDQVAFKSGIRKMTYREVNNVLTLFINGRRFIGRGGNWGFPESNLNYRKREYDIAVGYHADMNFTMIRNWVGQTGDDEFYDACDRYGIMVWQDFWLANPYDGPDPDDPVMFMENADNLIRRIRNHPSIAIYVGRNEGYPPTVLDTALRTLIRRIHPGMDYISSSSIGPVSGGGPYRALPPRDYFLLYGRNKLHSERGMPNVMTYEGLSRTIPESKMWPQNSLWGLHDYCLEGAQGAASFNEMIEKAFGTARDAREFTQQAQWINYNGYRAMFEGRSQFRKGLLLWMSHPAWPSMVWQTYDYYFEPTAAYFGCKKANEPVHIQWNPVYDSVEVVNYSAGFMPGLLVRARILNMDGDVRWEKDTTLDSYEDTTLKPFRLEFPDSLTEVHFIRLTLESDEKVISDNFYWRGKEPGNYQALNNLPDADVQVKTTIKRDGIQWKLESSLQNMSEVPALMIRLNVVDGSGEEQILPVMYEDNYFALLPGESKVVHMSVRTEDARGQEPEVKVTGFNIQD